MNKALTAPFPARPLNGGTWDTARAYPKPGTWAYQPKYNGWRALVHMPTGTIWNRHGQRLTIEDEFKTALGLINLLVPTAPFEWLDCEGLERRHGLFRGSLIILDVIAPLVPYYERREWLESLEIAPLQATDAPTGSTLFLTPSLPADSADELWSNLAAANKKLGCEFYEGFVAKEVTKRYPTPRKASEEFAGWVKHRWHF